eukprot:s308_g8.t1
MDSLSTALRWTANETGRAVPKVASLAMNRRHLCSYGAFDGFLRGQDVRSLAQAAKSYQERFANGDFRLHLRLETHQMSEIIAKHLKQTRLPRAEALRRISSGLDRFPKSPLLSLQLFEPGSFRDLYPLILEVLKKSSKLQKLDLHDISIDPIRAAHAAGQFHQEEALQLTKVLSESGRGLKQLGITAGSWSWESLCILFESLGKAGHLRHLRLRGKLMDAKGSHEALKGPMPQDKSLSVLGSVSDFSWQGSNIYDANYLESIILALPNAESRFRMESSGFWRGPYEVELRAFEKLSSLGRIKVAKDASYNIALGACSGTAWPWALVLLDELGEDADEMSLRAAISAMEEQGRWKQALELISWSHVQDMGRQLEPCAGCGEGRDPSSLRAAIATCGVAAQWQRALGLYRRGHAQDVYAGTAAVNACGNAGRWEQALQLVEDLRPVLNGFAFTALLTACGNAQRWQTAVQLLDAEEISGTVGEVVQREPVVEWVAWCRGCSDPVEQAECSKMCEITEPPKNLMQPKILGHWVHWSWDILGDSPQADPDRDP